MPSVEKITLYELNQKVKEVLAQSFNSKYWVIAEISEVKENSSGHCYIELIQKEEIKEAVKAKARATVWAYTYRMLKPYFETSTGRPLSAGMKVLVSVEVIFHEAYGYSLNITDIEPNFTLGDIERQRRETIERLIAEGVFDMNKGLDIPLLPKRVAVISSPTAAGLQDFVNQITSNKFGYSIIHTLFSANMQGNGAEESIIEALNSIYEKQNDFDIVVIIRGGGSQADLACFDSYWLSAHVAQFPLPIITGIGHDKDTSVVDLVANIKLKTPTAVAEFIIDKFFEAEALSISFGEKLKLVTEEFILNHKLRIEQPLKSIIPTIFRSVLNERIILERKQNRVSLTTHQHQTQNSAYLIKLGKLAEVHSIMKLEQSKSSIRQISQTLSTCVLNYQRIQNYKLNIYENRIESVDPIKILKMGYSITTYNGKVLREPKDLKKGYTIRTILEHGVIDSTVK